MKSEYVSAVENYCGSYKYANEVGREYKSYIEFATGLAPIIASRMAATYTAKKRAFEATNTQYRKTGSLDMTRLAFYKTSEDLFITKTIQKAGSNHGLYFVIDWSQSMTGCITRVAMQYLVTVMFCKKAGIPFKVAIFTSSNTKSKEASSVDCTTHKIIANEGCSVSELTNTYYHMISCSRDARSLAFSNTYATFIRAHFSMGGTPLLQSTMIAYMDAYKMRASRGIENMTIMYITDGVGGSISTPCGRYDANVVKCPFSGREYFIEDRVSTSSYSSYRAYKPMSMMVPINKMIRESGMKIFNLFIGAESEVASVYNSIHPYRKISELETLLVSKTPGVNVYKNLGYYDKFVQCNPKVFPIYDTTDEIGVDRKALTKAGRKTAKFSLICDMIVSEMCRDFSISG